LVFLNETFPTFSKPATAVVVCFSLTVSMLIFCRARSSSSMTISVVQCTRATLPFLL
jgi:hypothetical protein